MAFILIILIPLAVLAALLVVRDRRQRDVTPVMQTWLMHTWTRRYELLGLTRSSSVISSAAPVLVAVAAC